MNDWLTKFLFAPYWTNTYLNHKPNAKIGVYPNQKNTAWKADVNDIKKCIFKTNPH